MLKVAFIGVLGVLALSGAGFALWILRLPAPHDASPSPSPSSIQSQETRGVIGALKPRKPGPLIAILGVNNATETTDYLMAYGILKRAAVADVVALSTDPGPINLYPALRVRADATIAEFDKRNPAGADYVIVPAMDPEDNSSALNWIRQQAAKGARIIGVCAGAKVVANAGLLDGRRATTHWYYRKGLLKEHPSVRYVPDRRFVVDGNVMTTTGITASIPTMLTLIEAIGGKKRALAVAQDLGVSRWDARHSSAAFSFTRPFALTVIGNRLSFWKHETLGIQLRPGVDEVSLALVADAWSRTYRSRARSFASSPAIRSRNGIEILREVPTDTWPPGRRLPLTANMRPVDALDDALNKIETRYGKPTKYLVATQLEYAAS